MDRSDYLDHESDESAINPNWRPDTREETVERTARTGCSSVDLMDALRDAIATEQAAAAWKDLGPDAPLSAAPTLTELLGD